MTRQDFATFAHFLQAVTGAANFLLWLVAAAGINLWGPRLLLWATLVLVLWLAFIAGPLAVLLWRVGRSEGYAESYETNWSHTGEGE